MNHSTTCSGLGKLILRSHPLKYTIIFAPAAERDEAGVRAYDRRAVLDTIKRVLETVPTQLSKSRIKRLRGVISPESRLRVGEFRVFYNVRGAEVIVLRILEKSAATAYL